HRGGPDGTGPPRRAEPAPRAPDRRHRRRHRRRTGRAHRLRRRARQRPGADPRAARSLHATGGGGMSEFTLILATGLGLGALYFLAASGLSLIYGLMGVLNFA